MRYCFVIILSVFLCGNVYSQAKGKAFYRKTTAMIPMRDGVKLFTVICTPVFDTKTAFPILIERTPYGADFPVTNDSSLSFSGYAYIASMAEEGYIFVFQDIRGKYKSEGSMQIHQPLTHAVKKGSIDESTDTYDTVDWLVKN